MVRAFAGLSTITSFDFLAELGGSRTAAAAALPLPFRAGFELAVLVAAARGLALSALPR